MDVPTPIDSRLNVDSGRLSESPLPTYDGVPVSSSLSRYVRWTHISPPDEVGHPEDYRISSLRHYHPCMIEPVLQSLSLEGNRCHRHRRRLRPRQGDGAGPGPRRRRRRSRGPPAEAARSRRRRDQGHRSEGARPADGRHRRRAGGEFGRNGGARARRSRHPPKQRGHGRRPGGQADLGHHRRGVANRAGRQSLRRLLLRQGGRPTHGRARQRQDRQRIVGVSGSAEGATTTCTPAPRGA